MTDVISFNRAAIEESDCAQTTLLDFGCGLGHLYEYILKTGIDVEYTGLDISRIFVEKCKEKFPGTQFLSGDLLESGEREWDTYDYIVLNGVFTEKRELSFDEMFSYFKKLLVKIYAMCNKRLAFTAGYVKQIFDRRAYKRFYYSL